MKSKQFLASEHFWAKKLPQGWRYEFFGDLIKDTIDNRGRTVPTSDFGIPLIATNCISNFSLFPVFKDIRYVSQKTHDEWFRDGHAESNDIIFVNKGSPGHICLVPDPINFCFAQDMIGLKINHEKINFKYLFTIIRTRFMQEQIDAFHVGTLIPHFKKSDFNSIVIPIPPKKLEDVVGEYYFSISQKIENLQNQNHILEQMAQAIFKSWFVDFDGVTDLEDSELGKIPKGWTIESFGEIVAVTDYTANGSFAGLKENVTYSYDPNYAILVRQVDFNNNWNNDYVYVDKHSYDFLKKSFLTPDDIMVSNIGANYGTVFRVPDLGQPMTGAPNVLIIKCDNSNKEFVYLYLKSEIGQNAINSIVTGSAVPKFNKTDFRNHQFVYPDSKTILNFHEIIFPLSQLITRNEEQIKSLQKARDLLLPKLMSGEIRV